jgi:hypothetical protein
MNDKDKQIICGTVVLIIGFVALVASVWVGYQQLSSLNEMFYKNGSILPCDKIVTITSKFQRVDMIQGMPMTMQYITFGGQSVIFDDHFALDGGKSKWGKIPLNVTGILQGVSSSSEGQYVTDFIPINVTSYPGVQNACVVI